jgi:hypothetical protein
MLPINTSRAVVKSTLVARDGRGVNKTNAKASKQNVACLRSYDFVSLPKFPMKQQFLKSGKGEEPVSQEWARWPPLMMKQHARSGRTQEVALRRNQHTSLPDMGFGLVITEARNDSLIRIVSLESASFC